jgi:hypothetical protein
MPFSVLEYAAKIKKHPDTVRKWARNGNIRAKKSPGGKDWLIYEDPAKFL